jgi:hypothetical protein
MGPERGFAPRLGRFAERGIVQDFGNDAMLVAVSKGLVGGAVNVGLAAMPAGSLPATSSAFAVGTVGFLSYGVSLTLFVVALREIGVARAHVHEPVVHARRHDPDLHHRHPH